MKNRKASSDPARLDNAIAEARRAAEQRDRGYREQALKLFPWICGRCRREFTRSNLHELTVHHRNHNHDENPSDGSNWELLCLYCHDNEHSRQINATANTQPGEHSIATGNPFADLKERLASTPKRS